MVGSSAQNTKSFPKQCHFWPKLILDQSAVHKLSSYGCIITIVSLCSMVIAQLLKRKQCEVVNIRTFGQKWHHFVKCFQAKG